jgi:pilus assembly protein Flp/PilA
MKPGETAMSIVQAGAYRLYTLRRRLDEGDAGQALAEYGLILGLVAVVVVAAVTLVGTNLSSMLGSVANAL